MSYLNNKGIVALTIALRRFNGKNVSTLFNKTLKLNYYIK